MAATKAPNSRRNLDEAIKRAHGEDYLRARHAMANALVGQLLPEGVRQGRERPQAAVRERCDAVHYRL